MPGSASLTEFLKKYNPHTIQEGVVFLNGYWQGLDAAFSAMRNFSPDELETFHRKVSDDVWAKLKELGAV